MSIRHFQGSFVVAMAALILSCASPTGTVPAGTGGGGGGGGGSNPTSTNVSLSLTTGGASAVVSVDTSTYGGDYAPVHVLAVWVEHLSGTSIRTLDVRANARINHLTTWKAANGGSTTIPTDATSGATISSHAARSVTWNLKNHSGATVADGVYLLKAEMTESNSGTKVSTLSLTVQGGVVSVTP